MTTGAPRPKIGPIRALGNVDYVNPGRPLQQRAGGRATGVARLMAVLAGLTAGARCTLAAFCDVGHARPGEGTWTGWLMVVLGGVS
jgi:hypothetical protein